MNIYPREEDMPTYCNKKYIDLTDPRITARSSIREFFNNKSPESISNLYESFIECPDCYVVDNFFKLINEEWDKITSTPVKFRVVIINAKFNFEVINF